MSAAPTRTSLLGAALVAVAVGLASCGGSTSPSAAALDATVPGASATVAQAAPQEPASVKPCDVLTAEEFSNVTGAETTAVPDDLTGGCTYKRADGGVIATLTVAKASFGATLADTLVGSDLGFRELSGVGDRAIVAGAPEGRLVVIAGPFAFDLSRASGTALPEDQLTKLAEAIIAS